MCVLNNFTFPTLLALYPNSPLSNTGWGCTTDPGAQIFTHTHTPPPRRCHRAPGPGAMRPLRHPKRRRCAQLRRPRRNRNRGNRSISVSPPYFNNGTKSRPTSPARPPPPSIPGPLPRRGGFSLGRRGEVAHAAPSPIPLRALTTPGHIQFLARVFDRSPCKTLKASPWPHRSGGSWGGVPALCAPRGGRRGGAGVARLRLPAADRCGLGHFCVLRGSV